MNFKILFAGLLIGIIVGIYTHSENNNGKIIFPKRIKEGFKMGVLREILTCTLATFVSILFNLTMGITDIFPLIVNGTFAALIGKEYLVRQRTEALNEAQKIKELRMAELDTEIVPKKKGKGKETG